MQFRVSLPNLQQLQTALAQYPTISAPIFQRAILAAQAVLAKYTNASTVPIRSGYLSQNWASEIVPLQLRYYPRAAYAPFVEFGTGPHTILAVNKRVLANKETGQVFGPRVRHPGTKANPFMERIVAASQSEINDVFVEALNQITTAIANA